MVLCGTTAPCCGLLKINGHLLLSSIAAIQYTELNGAERMGHDHVSTVSISNQILLRSQVSCVCVFNRSSRSRSDRVTETLVLCFSFVKIYSIDNVSSVISTKQLHIRSMNCAISCTLFNGNQSTVRSFEFLETKAVSVTAKSKIAFRIGHSNSK